MTKDIKGRCKKIFEEMEEMFFSKAQFVAGINTWQATNVSQQRRGGVNNSSIFRRYQKHGLPMCQHFGVDPDLDPRIHASD